MYYEEMIIDGVLCFRNTPDSDWKELSKEELTNRINKNKEENKTPDLSWLWHCSTDTKNNVDYNVLISDDKVIANAMNKAYENGFRGCLRKIEDLELIDMQDIDRSLEIKDQDKFDKEFEN